MSNKNEEITRYDINGHSLNISIWDKGDWCKYSDITLMKEEFIREYKELLLKAENLYATSYNCDRDSVRVHFKEERYFIRSLENEWKSKNPA